MTTSTELAEQLLATFAEILSVADAFVNGMEEQEGVFNGPAF